MLRTMREKTKIIMLILAVAFVGWLIFDVGMGVTGRGQGQSSRDLGQVNGSPITYQQWLQTYQALADQERQRLFPRRQHRLARFDPLGFIRGTQHPGSLLVSLVWQFKFQ